MKIDVPEEKRICKYCSHCECYNEDAEGRKYCNMDIGVLVDVNNSCCSEFDYDDTFMRM